MISLKTTYLRFIKSSLRIFIDRFSTNQKQRNRLFSKAHYVFFKNLQKQRNEDF